MQFYDMHSHILPNIDDGAKTLEDSLKLLSCLEKQGVTNVCLTPHFYTNEISAEDFATLYEMDKQHINLLDARRKSEFDSEHLVGAENFPLDFINHNMSHLDRNKKYFIHCAGGYRSVIMASILKARGFEHLVNIQGGYNALSKTGLKKTHYVEPITML